MPHGITDKARRDLVRSGLDLMVLSVLANGAQHGYAIGRQLAQATGYPVGAGTLYPLLHRLAADGSITDERRRVGGRERRVWRLTEAGRGALRAAATEWQATVARIQGLMLPALRRLTFPPRD